MIAFTPLLSISLRSFFRTLTNTLSRGNLIVFLLISNTCSTSRLLRPQQFRQRVREHTPLVVLPLPLYLGYDPLVPIFTEDFCALPLRLLSAILSRSLKTPI